MKIFIIAGTGAERKTVETIELVGLTPVAVNVPPGASIVYGSDYCPTGGTISLRQPPEAIMPPPALPESRPNRGPYASDQPWKKGKKR